MRSFLRFMFYVIVILVIEIAISSVSILERLV